MHATCRASGWLILQIPHGIALRACTANAKSARALARILLNRSSSESGGAVHVRQRRGFQEQNTVLTFGDVVAAVSAVTSDEREVVAVVLHMLRRESIRFSVQRPSDRSRGTAC